jgi:hypothetical protein
MLQRALLLAATVAFSLTGCATQPAAMDQANNTVALMSSLETQLSEFRKSWSALEISRIETLKTQRRLLAKTDIAAERSHIARVAAGDANSEALRTRLLVNTDAIQNAKASTAKDRQLSEKRLATLLQPIPSTARTIAAAQSSAAKMGTELSKETRTTELLAFVQDVKDGIDKAKKAQQDAKDAATATADKIVSAEKL